MDVAEARRKTWSSDWALRFDDVGIRILRVDRMEDIVVLTYGGSQRVLTDSDQGAEIVMIDNLEYVEVMTE